MCVCPDFAAEQTQIWWQALAAMRAACAFVSRVVEMSRRIRPDLRALSRAQQQPWLLPEASLKRSRLHFTYIFSLLLA